jgi:hypothetical protein
VSIQADISLDFGKILFSANRDTEAWKHIEIALMKASYIGNRLTLHVHWSTWAMGTSAEATTKMRMVPMRPQLKNTLVLSMLDTVERCKDNMARIKQKQGNPDTVIGFYRHGLDIC